MSCIHECSTIIVLGACSDGGFWQLRNLFCEASGLGMTAAEGGEKRSCTSNLWVSCVLRAVAERLLVIPGMILLLNRDNGWASHYQVLRPP